MNDKYISLIAKYLSGDIDAREREMLFELVNNSEDHKAYFEEMQSLWDLTEDKDEDIAVDTTLAWQKVVKRVNPVVATAAPKKTTRIFNIGGLLKIAAVLIGVMGAIWLFTRSENVTPQLVQHQTINKERKEVTLPDGSKVWLNENSTLSFDQNFEPRFVHLEGEAFFEVKHLDKDHKFEILSGDTKTTVLGTSFNVRAYPEEDQVEVTVETGKVVLKNEKVKKAEKEEVILTAGESGIYNKKETGLIKPENNISNADAWKTQRLDFKDARLSEVIEVMERYFDIEIQTKNQDILNCFLTGAYENPEIDQLIDVLEFSLELDINQNENLLTFSGEGCK